MTAPTVYIATSSASKMLPFLDEGHKPSLLIAFVYLWAGGGFKRRPMEDSWVDTWRAKTCYRSWCLDSGAFSAYTLGWEVNPTEYAAYARDLWQADPTLDMVFGLDAIAGDWRDTLRNTQMLWAAGVPGVPTYHVGEPEDVLIGYARDFPKVAIGGMVPLKGGTKHRFAEQCFARVWPCALHGFGVGQQELCYRLPWHSVDASSAEVSPRKFGVWFGFNNGKREFVGARRFYDLRVEISYYLKMEEMMRHRWAVQMEQLAPRLRAAGMRGYQEGA